MSRWAFLAILLSLPFLPARVTADEDSPPTPAERIAGMRKKCAEERARLGTWANSKKLGSAAKAQFLLAIDLDPDCRRARQRLGHKRNAEGVWTAKRKKEWEYGRGAMEKHGEELKTREREVLGEEVSAFEVLGLALIAEGEAELGHKLCFRAHLLAPTREGAAEGIGLVPFAKAFVTKEVSAALREIPEVEKVEMQGPLAQALGTRTLIRRCGAAVVETAGRPGAADELAKLCHRAQRLVTCRFGIHSRPIGWITLVVAQGQAQFNSFVDRCGAFQEPWLSACKTVGSARAYFPRHFSASFVGPMGDPVNLATLFIHTAAEDVLVFQVGGEGPAWLMEAVGIDANLVLRGVPGQACVVFEESSGLNQNDPLSEPLDWPRRVLRQAVLGTLPHLPLLLRAQFQALSPDDLIAGREYYRYLNLTNPKGFGTYLKRLSEEAEPEVAFKDAFGKSAEEVEEEFGRVLRGGD
jgi:hypothetical protein